MNEAGSFERFSEEKTEASRNLLISLEDHQFLCKSILETANDLRFESSPDSLTRTVSSIKLNEKGNSTNGTPYAPHTSLAMQAIFSKNAEPVATIKLSGRNALTTVFSLNDTGGWEQLRSAGTSDSLVGMVDEIYTHDLPTYDHASMLSLIESRLKMSVNDNRTTGNDPYTSERYKALMRNMDTVHGDTRAEVESLLDTLQPFAAANEEITEYSADFAYTEVSHYAAPENGYYPPQDLNYQSLLRTMLLVKTNTKGIDCRLSISSPYVVKNTEIQKTYNYVLSRKKGNLLPEFGSGTVTVSGRKVATSKEKLAEYASVDQFRNEPVESLLRGLERLHDQHTKTSAVL